ncbi:pseudouridine synthase [Paenibacillus vini]|uniref:Pseudouridine synthase n=2 Tax=Paenibacillus vini TaxID=1476024 RepID=A0ABQ4MHU0_9BACL|nr:pseudouridine synthase [Paenibacillus vini]
MSKGMAGQRRGEWLELMPGKLNPPEHGGRYEAALVWLERELGCPAKLLRSLDAEGGIKLAGDRLRVRLFPPKISQYEPVEQPVRILYEDDFCLVVHKSAGIKVHPDGESREPSLANFVSGIYSLRDEPVAPAHIHRLDEYTTGPVLYAKNIFAQLKLDAAMARKEIERVYVALVEGVVNPALIRINEPIGRDRHHPSRRRVSKAGKEAVTRVEVLETFPKASLVRLRLETGRTHQIRVHMSHAGHPLIGDALYGGSTKLLPHQALHGESLAFPHPLTGETVEVPDSWPEEWDKVRAWLHS